MSRILKKIREIFHIDQCESSEAILWMLCLAHVCVQQQLNCRFALVHKYNSLCLFRFFLRLTHISQIRSLHNQLSWLGLTQTMCRFTQSQALHFQLLISFLCFLIISAFVLAKVLHKQRHYRRSQDVTLEMLGLLSYWETEAKTPCVASFLSRCQETHWTQI